MIPYHFAMQNRHADSCRLLASQTLGQKMLSQYLAFKRIICPMSCKSSAAVVISYASSGSPIAIGCTCNMG